MIRSVVGAGGILPDFIHMPNVMRYNPILFIKQPVICYMLWEYTIDTNSFNLLDNSYGACFGWRN